MTSRRDFLKVGTVAVAASALPTTPPVAAFAEAAPVPAAIVPAKLSPYGNYVWEWFVSNDGETYYEPFPTKEEALEYARRSEYSLIAECQMQDFDLSIPAWVILERLDENNYERIGDGEGIQCTPAQDRDLEAMVQKAIEAWVVKHNINITAWSFGATKNQQAVSETPAPLCEDRHEA